MHIAVIVPAHNEAAFLPGFLSSIYNQTRLPDTLVMVDDNSEDQTAQVIAEATQRYSFIKGVSHQSHARHQPGAKVVEAFNVGLAQLDASVEIIVKLDADLILPPNYFAVIEHIFKTTHAGIVGGVIKEQNQQGKWEVRHPMGRDHVRGALKGYRRECLEKMQGLRQGMGWDTVDEHLARFYGYTVEVVLDLRVRHCRPVGQAYAKQASAIQGKAFYQMRYGTLLTLLAAIKYGFHRRSFNAGMQALLGAWRARKAKKPFFVTPDQGRFIRRWRWRQVVNKIQRTNNPLALED